MIRTTEGLRTDKLRKGMNEPMYIYPDRALKDTDEPATRSSSVPPKEKEPTRIEKSRLICFRCGRRGHLSNNCNDWPSASSSKPSDSASVVFDMSPWADEFAEWRREQEPGLASEPQTTEDINGLEETRGCAVLDSGATVMCSSTVAAEAIQQQRLDRSEPG